MPFACIHTHTLFCDGHDDVETCCRSAHDKGLESLGFSSHAPIIAKTGMPSNWNIPDDRRLHEYFDDVRAARKRWQGKLPVYLGLEVDYIPGLMGPADRDYREMDLDYIIGAVHFVMPPKGAPFTVDDSPENVQRGISEGFGGDAMGMLESYWSSVEAMIRAGGFDVLAHPDVVKKNNSFHDGRSGRFFSEDDDFYRKKTAAAASLLARTGIAAEINTGGINRGKIRDCYPSHHFLKLFRENNTPMVINADAHTAGDLDGHYDEARRALLAAGYAETVLFNGRKNGRAVWKPVKL